MRKPTARGAAERVMQLTDFTRCASSPKAVVPCIWSQPHGSRIVFHALDPVQGKGRRLADIRYTSPNAGYEWDVSPDGSQIALLDLDDRGARIVIISTSDGSSKPIPLEPGAGKPLSISWAADGKGFYVSSRGYEAWDLLYLTMAGKVRTLWHPNARQWVVNPKPSPDGKHLAFNVESFDANVWLIDNF
jgi:Tol biopolymer transport system component